MHFDNLEPGGKRSAGGGPKLIFNLLDLLQADGPRDRVPLVKGDGAGSKGLPA
jgi:hypothetical protein